MKRINTYLIAVFFVFFSCSKTTETDKPGLQLTQKEAFEQFSIILSKAVYSEPALREFIKNEALKQYDKDYDVFYPWTKGQIVDGRRSFGEILEAYDSDDCLHGIEAILPKLTIHIPDWQWIHPDAFSIKNWDTDNEIVVVSFNSGNSEIMYYDGHYLDAFPSSTVPSFPVLIIKQNERMQLSGGTKSNPLNEYTFTSSEFDNTATKTVVNDTIEIQHVIWGDYMSGHPMTGRLGDVYEETQYHPEIAQRDYIYYNMTVDRNVGNVDYGYKERMYYMKLPYVSNRFMTDEIDYDYGDFKLHTRPDNTGVSSDDKYDLKQKIWRDGALDFYFDIFVGTDYMTKYASVTFGSLFQLKKVYEQYVPVGNLRTQRVFSVDDSCFEPKWCLLNYDLFTWDIRDIPDKYKITIREYDEGTTYSFSHTETSTYMRNHSWNIEAGIPLNFNINGFDLNLTIKGGYKYGNEQTTTDTNSWTISWTQGSDDFGSFYVQYIDPILLSPVVANGQPDTHVYVYKTGLIDMVMLPRQL